jgi:hypothetical protein
MEAQPGILYVQSRIVSDSLSPELFKKWYEDVHIPDILATSGFNSAFRYISTSPDTVDRPYLALYPTKDVNWLYSKEFFSIPLHSDILPNNSKAIFELANFDNRYYETMDTKPLGDIQG